MCCPYHASGIEAILTLNMTSNTCIAIQLTRKQQVHTRKHDYVITKWLQAALQHLPATPCLCIYHIYHVNDLQPMMLSIVAHDLTFGQACPRTELHVFNKSIQGKA